MADEINNNLDYQGGSHVPRDQCQCSPRPDGAQPSTSGQEAGQSFPAPWPAALPGVEEVEVEDDLIVIPEFDNEQDYLDYLNRQRRVTNVRLVDLTARVDNMSLRHDVHRDGLPVLGDFPEAEVQTCAFHDTVGGSTSTSIAFEDTEEISVTKATHEADPQDGYSASSHVGMIPHLEDKEEPSGSAATKTEQKPTLASSSPTASRKRSAPSETSAITTKKIVGLSSLRPGGL